MATTLSFPLPRIPAIVVKYIAKTFLKNHDGTPNVEILINLFKAFTGVENDDLYTLYYKENVWQYLSVLMYDTLDERYTLSDNTFPYILSPLDIAWVYEITFLEHYSQSNNYNLKEFDDITNLLEDTSLYDNEPIMGLVGFGYHVNIKDMKFINILEKALMQKRGELIRFIYENTYAPIMAFYLYVKHNHVDYRTKENSLANDEGLLDLLIYQGGYQKEVLALAIGGLFPNHFVYKKTSSTDDIIIEEHMVMPNREVVKNIIDQFPAIRDELIPFYMRSRIELEIDEVYGEEGPAEITPLGYWQDYKNTFEERTHIDRSNDIFRKRTITVEKDESILMCLLAH